MMRKAIGAAAAVLALAACDGIGGDGGSGPALPELQAGAQAPMTMEAGSAQQATLNDEQRAQLEQLVGSYLDAVQERAGPSLAPCDETTAAAARSGSGARSSDTGDACRSNDASSNHRDGGTATARAGTR